jgi:hypothetical protein
MKKVSILVAMALLPLSSFAALGNISGLVDDVAGIVNKLIPIVFTLAILTFFWGLVKFIFGGPNAGDAKDLMIWGIVAVAVMSSIWGLVRFLGSAFGVTEESAPTIDRLIPKK